VFRVKTDSFDGSIMLIPSGHPIHSFEWKQQQPIIIAASGNHIMIGRDPQSTNLLFMRLIPIHFGVHPPVLNRHVTVLAACDNQVVGAAYRSDPARVQVLYTVVRWFVQVEYLHVAFVRTDC
jgi:hypothetical protein